MNPFILLLDVCQSRGNEKAWANVISPVGISLCLKQLFSQKSLRRNTNDPKSCTILPEYKMQPKKWYRKSAKLEDPRKTKPKNLFQRKSSLFLKHVSFQWTLSCFQELSWNLLNFFAKPFWSLMKVTGGLPKSVIRETVGKRMFSKRNRAFLHELLYGPLRSWGDDLRTCKIKIKYLTASFKLLPETCHTL